MKSSTFAWFSRHLLLLLYYFLTRVLHILCCCIHCRAVVHVCTIADMFGICVFATCFRIFFLFPWTYAFINGNLSYLYIDEWFHLFIIMSSAILKQWHNRLNQTKSVIFWHFSVPFSSTVFQYRVNKDNHRLQAKIADFIFILIRPFLLQTPFLTTEKYHKLVSWFISYYNYILMKTQLMSNV